MLNKREGILSVEWEGGQPYLFRYCLMSIIFYNGHDKKFHSHKIKTGSKLGRPLYLLTLKSIVCNYCNQLQGCRRSAI